MGEHGETRPTLNLFGTAITWLKRIDSEGHEYPYDGAGKQRTRENNSFPRMRRNHRDICWGKNTHFRYLRIHVLLYGCLHEGSHKLFERQSVCLRVALQCP